MSWRVLQLQLCLVVICYYSINGTAITSTELTEIKSNAVFPSSLANAIQPTSFPLFVVGAAPAAMTFVKIIISSVGIVLNFIENNIESKELLEIKSLHVEMSKRFDEVNLQLKDIKIQIEWSQVVSELGSIEQDMNANYARLQSIFSSPISMKKSATDDFLAGYKISCINCAMKLYQEITGDDGLINGDIFRKVKPVLKYDRHKMQMLMIGIFQLLVKGVCAELLYDQLVHGDVYYTMYHKKWLERVIDVTSRMTLVDTEVKNKWYEQTGTDIDHVSVQYSAQSNKNFSSTLYIFLREKYYWRDWLVIVYKPIIGTKYHENFVCGGYKKYSLHGRNIVVASVDATMEAINTTEALEIIRNTHTILHPKKVPPILSLLHIKHDHKLNAADLYDDLPNNCSMYASVGVIDSWVDLWYQGPPDRLVHMRTPGVNSYSLHYFG